LIGHIDIKPNLVTAEGNSKSPEIIIVRLIRHIQIPQITAFPEWKFTRTEAVVPTREKDADVIDACLTDPPSIGL
jgi:hypothetical protein